MTGAMSSFKGVLTYLPTPILSKIDRERDKRRADQSTSSDQWECGARCVDYWRRTIQIPNIDDDGLGVHGTGRIRVCATTQSRQIPTEHGELPRTSAWN